MHLMGQGRFRQLTTRLGQPAARKFSDELYRACGCRLAWQMHRHVYVVYRDRGRSVSPTTYADIPRPDFSRFNEVVESVRWADARRGSDFIKMAEVFDRQDKARSEQETAAFVDEFIGDFHRDMRDVAAIATTGRPARQTFDMGAVTGPKRKKEAALVAA